jgi:predicted O-methyltransferase YrrM
MRPIMGWFTEQEAELLLDTAAQALLTTPHDHAVVEIGSYCGRSTMLLASAIRDLRPSAQMTAIDPHDGVISLAGQPDQSGAATYEAFRRNLTAAGVGDSVEIIRLRSVTVPWNRPIGLLFIDGLHDYDSVRADFEHFERHIAAGGFVAFHDYSQNFPGVIDVVDDVAGRPGYEQVARAGELVVVRKKAVATPTGDTYAAAPPAGGEPCSPRPASERS